MTLRGPRLERVQRDDGYFARFLDADGNLVWATPDELTRQTVDEAIGLLLVAVRTAKIVDVDARTP